MIPTKPPHFPHIQRPFQLSRQAPPPAAPHHHETGTVRATAPDPGEYAQDGVHPIASGAPTSQTPSTATEAPMPSPKHAGTSRRSLHAGRSTAPPSTAGRCRRLPSCTVRCAVNVSATHTKPRSPRSAITGTFAESPGLGAGAFPVQWPPPEPTPLHAKGGPEISRGARVRLFNCRYGMRAAAISSNG